MDLNYILGWFAGLSGVVGLFSHLRYRRSGGWIAAYVAVVATLLVALAVRPAVAGYASMAAWSLLVALPMFGNRWINRLVARHHYGWAKALSRLLAVVHPTDGGRDQPAMLLALQQIHLGDLGAARAALERAGTPSERAARFVELQGLRADASWEEILRQIETGPERWGRDEGPLLLYLRALGETGQVARMLQVLDRRSSDSLAPSTHRTIAQFALAFTGRPERLQRLFAGPLADVGPGERSYWLAVAHQVLGDQARAVALLNGLVRAPDRSLRAASRRRLQLPLPVFDESLLDPGTAAALVRFHQQLNDGLRFGSHGLGATPPAYATRALMLANALIFLVAPNGASDPESLIAFGALVVPKEMVAHPLLRTISAGFLHFGAVHLAANLLGLWLFGRFLENAWGRTRVVLCFLATSIGANLIALTVVTAHPDQPIVMAGASSGVMGIMGASFAFVAFEWRRRRLPILAHQVRMFALGFSVQMLFDAMTPEVSSTLHLGGLILGLAIGSLMALSERRQPEPVAG